MTIEVFISWSGQKSRAIAQCLAEALPAAVPSCKPWLSHHDIPSGSRWAVELAAALARCRCAVIVLTAENIASPWILFEAGAIASPKASNLAIPLLVDIESSDLPAPLAQFQSESLNQHGFSRLCHVLAKLSLPTGADQGPSPSSIESAWSQVSSKIDEIQIQYNSVRLRSRMKPYAVTSGEMRVLEKLATGVKPSEIAREYAVSISTVRSQISSLRAKTGAKSIQELIEFAKQDELLDRDDA